jgi:CRP/FNR family cyclic AMP-dependent transcriptional regulator
MNSRLAKVLGSLDPFKSLSEASLEALAVGCRFARFEPKQQIIGYLDESAEVFFIVSGSVRVVIDSPLGKEVSYRDLESGEMFGELSAIDGEQRAASVVSLSDTIVVGMPQENFRTAFRTHSSVAEAVLKRLTNIVRLYGQRMYEFRALDVKSRVRAELIRMAGQCVADDNTATISALPPHAVIANRVCARREAVSRELADLARRGLVERNRNSLKIRDFRRLTEMLNAVLGEDRRPSSRPHYRAPLVPEPRYAPTHPSA